MELPLTEGTFRAFGSACRIVADVTGEVIGRLADRAEDLEARWSRFRPDSEVSRCNAARGRPVAVSTATVELFERANAATLRTDGRFNALLLNDLVALGYDRDHGALTPAAAALDPAPGPAVVDRTIETVEIGADGVRVPAHAAFDPGGLGKGLAADLLLADLVEDGARWAYVSLGGDMRFGGDVLAEQGAPVGIEHPWAPDEVIGEVTVFGGAVATSSLLKRTWTNDRGEIHHHLLDPTTRRPVRGGRVAATVHGRDAWWADVVAKCCLIDDRVDADQVIEWGCAGVVFTADRTLEQLGWSGLTQEGTT